jgi:hypothetical protein
MAAVAWSLSLAAAWCLSLACAGSGAAFAPPLLRIPGGPALLRAARTPALTITQLNRAKKNLGGAGQDDGDSPQVGPQRC